MLGTVGRYHDACAEDILSTEVDVQSARGGNHYACGGYHEHRYLILGYILDV